MKSIVLSALALVMLSGSMREVSVAHAAIDPELQLVIARHNQNAVLSWFGSNAVAYQVEASPTLETWTNLGPILIGNGAMLVATNPVTAQDFSFYRVKRMLFDAPASAIFDPTTGVLTIVGNEQPNLIVVSRDVTGNIQINNGSVIVTGPAPTIANTTLIQIFGRAGNDLLSLDEANGALPVAHLFGETDNDTLTGGSGGDVLNGGPGLDALFGMGGADSLLGGDDNDTVRGGEGNDVAQLGLGEDRFIWNPGDATDVIEGGDGLDTIEINGENDAEDFTVTANGTRVRFDRLDPGQFFLDIGTCEILVLNANGGDDWFACTGNLLPLIKITADGGSGEDTLLGSNGADLLMGGDQDDFIDGQQGNDTVFLGEGDDTFQWDPGDGLDTVEGQAGNDTMLFNGSAANEIYEASANGTRVRFTRNLGNIVMDLNDVENLNLKALGGTDLLTVNDLSGTDLVRVYADLAGTFGGSTGDAQIDTIIVNGTSGDDVITAMLSNEQLQVNNRATTVFVEHYEIDLDSVRIMGLAGHDVIDASAVGAGGPILVLDGGSGDDILLGGEWSDTLLGGDHDDVLFGGGGVDVLDGGLGENLVLENGNNPTNGVVSIFGDNASNTITISRNIAGSILSNGVPIPGATVINTGLIRVFGREADDVIILNESNGALPPAALYGGAGNDTLIGGSGADLIFGGIGHDTLLGKGGFDITFGGANDDTLTGGDAEDQAFGQAGNDRFVWNPGDDTDLNEGGSSTDTVEVNGGNGPEDFTVTANGTRVRFDRIDPGPFALDIGTCENLVLNANGGDDWFACTGNLLSLIKITADGGSGEDTLLGSNGADLLMGGDQDDFIDGQQGNDTVFLGEGDDTFQWDPGDGLDTVEGQAGNDTLLFNGSAGSEIFEASVNGTRVRFTRNLGSIVMDLDDVENLDLKALGGTDALTVNDLSGTDLINLSANLAGTFGGNTGDAQADNVIINGTAGNDVVYVTNTVGVATVFGLATTVTLSNSEVAIDRLTINTLAGDDVLDASGLSAGIIALTADSGLDDDILIGSDGADILLGGAGDDVLLGGPGIDVLDGGPGDNILIPD